MAIIGDDKPEIDYLEQLKAKLRGAAEIVSMRTSACQKGAAKASIRSSQTTVAIYWNNQRLTVETTNAPKLIEKAKGIWRRELRGPSIKQKAGAPV